MHLEMINNYVNKVDKKETNRKCCKSSYKNLIFYDFFSNNKNVGKHDLYLI